MQTNIEIKKVTIPQQFVHPEGLIQGLLFSLNSPCNCGQIVEQSQMAERQLNEQIRSQQKEISAIRSQVAEVENLLHTRDDLYRELDQLREQRQHIESEIENSRTVESTETVKYSGYREMNDRLRKRIFEVREFIQKMTYENQKIEGGIISNEYTREEVEFQRTRREVEQPVYEGRRFNNTGGFQSMVSRLHDKQDEAWRRVRRQEEDIERRNINARTRLGNTFTQKSPKARTYYSPNRQIY